MRRARFHPLIALLCALCLLGAQQLAHAHIIGHLGTVTGTTAYHAGGSGDDAPGLESACSTCAAYAALSSAPPTQANDLLAGCAPVAQPFVAVSRFTPAPPVPPYASRAPPAVL